MHPQSEPPTLGQRSPTSGQRIPSLDALKFLCCLTVVFIHAPGGKEEFPANLFLHLCGWAVPCFFVISGFFFAKKLEKSNYSFEVAFRSSLRIFSLFLLWSFFYAVVPPFEGVTSSGIVMTVLEHLQNIVRYIHSFVFTGFTYHLWYLSSLTQGFIIVWICLRYTSLRTALFLGAGLFIFATLGTSYGQTTGIHAGETAVKGPFTSVLYVTLGALIAKNLTFLKQPSIAGLKLLLLGLFIQAIELSYLWSVQHDVPGKYSVLFGFPPFAAGCVLLSLSFSQWGSATLAPYGKYALGIYLVHPYVINLTNFFGLTHPHSNPFLAAILVACISFGLIAALSRLPLVRNAVL